MKVGVLGQWKERGASQRLYISGIKTWHDFTITEELVRYSFDFGVFYFSFIPKLVNFNTMFSKDTVAVLFISF